MNSFKGGLVLLCVSLLGSPVGRAVEPPPNLIMNGAFEAGNQYWHGDGKVVSLPDGNKVYQIEAASNRLHIVSQPFRMHGLKEVQIVFRARSLKYTGKSLRISIHRPGGGAVMFDRDLPEDGAWKDFHINYNQNKVEEERVLNIAVHEGSGIVQIDDVEVRDVVEKTTETPAKPATPDPVVANNGKTMPKPATSVAPNAPTTPAPALTPAPSSPARFGAAGTYPSEYLDKAQALMKTTWNWKASGGNYNGVTTFTADGMALDFPGKKQNGDWRIDNDGTLTYRRGDDYSVVWQLKEAGPGSYAGEGISGAARGRTCTLNVGQPLAGQEATAALPVSKPLPQGDITSLAQVLDSAPASVLSKFRDPATIEEGVTEMNAYLNSQVRGRHVRMKVPVEKAQELDDHGRKMYRLKVPDNAIDSNQAGVKLLWFFVYIPKENMADPSTTLPPGSQVTVTGDLTRCDLKNVGGWRLNANVSGARILP